MVEVVTGKLVAGGWGNGTTETTETNGTVAASQGLSHGRSAKGAKARCRRVSEVADVSVVPSIATRKGARNG